MSPAWWLVAALVVALFLVARRLNGARARDARSGARLAGVLEGVSAGLSVWSPEQQLVACNSRFREFYPGVELKPGLVFEDLLRYTATRGVVRLDEREIASWVTDRVSRFSEAGVDVRRSADGGWLEMRCVTTGQGEVVMLYTDVTEVRDAARSHERDDERRNRASAERRLAQAAAAIARNAQSFDVALRQALALVCDYTGWIAGHAYRCASGEPASLASTGIWHLAGGDELALVREHLARMSPGQHEGVAARAARSGETVWVANVSVDPRIDSDLRTLLTGVRGICAVPVVAAGEVVAVLEFLAREQLVPDASLTRALQEISAGLSEACARLRETQPVEPGSSQ